VPNEAQADILSIEKGKKEIYQGIIIFYDAEVANILDLLKEWLLIYTWVELWVIVGATVLMVSIWYVFSLMLGIQNTLLRATAIWSLIFGLTAGAATTNWLVKRRRDAT
jgi:hypothetical protein